MSDYSCGMAQGGCGQAFQGGRVYWTWSTGAHVLTGAVQNAWIGQGWEAGPLGYPTTDLICGMRSSGCGQVFQGGRIYSTPSTGTFAITGSVHDAWIASGYEVGSLGYPTTGLICGMRDSGCGQVFQGGRIYSSPATGAHVLTGAVQNAWIGQGWEAGPLGYPTTDLICGMRSSGCGQVFQGGRIYSTPSTGTFAIAGSVHDAWIASGYEVGSLGYPTTGLICGMRDSGCGQVFQGGRIYSTPTTGTHAMTGAIHTAWINQGYEVGPLGYPTSDPRTVTGGTAQDFQGGTVYATGTGTSTVTSAYAAVHAALGGPTGALGLPTTGLICGMRDSGCGQVFQGGRIYSTPTTGTHAMTGAIHTAWINQGYEVGPLGYPTSDPRTVTGGTAQDFQGGTVYSSPAGTFVVRADYVAARAATGGDAGALGLPTTGLICGMRSSGCGQVFQGGRIYSTPTTGTHAMTGAIHTAWINQGYEVGPLGYPTSDVRVVSGGLAQDFQGGTLTLDQSSGAVTRS